MNTKRRSNRLTTRRFPVKDVKAELLIHVLVDKADSLRIETRIDRRHAPRHPLARTAESLEHRQISIIGIDGKSIEHTESNRMVDCDLDTSVLDWVIEYPITVSVFQQLGIDYCCGGISLEYACLKRELDAQTVLSMLRSCVEVNKSNDCSHD